jgi:hypothetical protein
MSSYINSTINDEREEYSIEYKDGECVKTLKPYTCESCRSKFLYIEDLKEHLSKHVD